MQWSNSEPASIWHHFQYKSSEELGIIHNFQTKEIDFDEIILPMRDISEHLTRANIERAWMASNNVMIHEHKSTRETMQRVVKILDLSMKKQISMQS